jgi:electron transport complex protein RnfC
MAPSIRIDIDPNSTQMQRPRIVPRWQDVKDEDLSKEIARAGIVGLGGAAFPSHVKMCPPKDQPVELLLINGCECEPYLTSDHRTMLEQPDKVYEGIRIALKALGISRAVIGIEANKPDAIEMMRKTAPEDMDVTIQPLTVKYPQGAEKMLIKAVMNREVPSGALPSSIGALVQNVATAANVAIAFETGQPLIERIITVSGRGIRKPGNWVIPFGTKLRDVIEHCGGLTEDASEIVFGGPMMGQGQANLDVPVLKATGGILVLSKDECKQQEIMPCIRCGKCIDACPIFLNPQLMGALAKAERYEELETEAHLGDCMLCGCCSFVCPSNIPLSQFFAMSRTQLKRLAS